MEILGHFLDDFGALGLILGVAVFIAYLGESEGTDLERLNAALRRRWVMATWVVTALLAWCVTWFHVANGDSYMPGFGRWPWLPAALIACVLASAAVALLAIRYWPPLRPWLTLLLALVMIVGSKSVSGAAPQKEMMQGTYGDEVTFVQERLESLNCYEKNYKPQPRDFDNPTYFAVMRFQQVNGLLLDRVRDFHKDGVVRPDIEFSKLANPFASAKACPS